MTVIEEIKEALMTGNANGVKEGAIKALAEGYTPNDIINDALITAMSVIGVKFKNNEVYIPEVLIAARAMHAGMDVVKPLLTGDATSNKGTVLVGTVKGDMHDIGKNLVIMVLEGAGYQVIDLGVDVTPDNFVKAVEKYQPKVLGLSALLTTTMGKMKETLEALKPYRDRVKVIIGGAPVTQSFADEIGADGFAANAAEAVERVNELVANEVPA